MFTVICVRCGKAYKVEKYRLDKTKFCSKRCNALTPNKKRDRAKVKALKGRIPANKQSPELKKAKTAFFQQRTIARRLNGAGWDSNFTFEVWYNLWLKSGYWGKRGRGKGKYQMARFGDKGWYSKNNVHIITIEANLSERDKVQFKGENNPMSKFIEKDIIEIRKLEGKVSRVELARRFNTNPWHIRDIQKRRCWKHVE